MDKLLILNLKNIDKNLNTKPLIENLPPSRKKLFLSAKHTKRKQLILWGYYLVKYALGFNGYPDFLYTDLGKPYILDMPYFNISHSGDYIVIATSDTPIGVDIEKPIFYRHALVKKICSPYEQNQLKNCFNKTDFLTNLWVHKESYIKLYAQSVVTSLHEIKINQPKHKYYKTKLHDGFYICACERIKD